jgi:hypothetical protein
MKALKPLFPLCGQLFVKKCSSTLIPLIYPPDLIDVTRKKRLKNNPRKNNQWDLLLEHSRMYHQFKLSLLSRRFRLLQNDSSAKLSLLSRRFRLLQNDSSAKLSLLSRPRPAYFYANQPITSCQSPITDPRSPIPNPRSPAPALYSPRGQCYNAKRSFSNYETRISRWNTLFPC